jgi:hypothetical protein
MRSKTIGAITLVLPLLMLGCNKADSPSPSSSAPSQERQAMAPSAEDRMLQSAPPAAGPTSNPDESAPSSSTSPAATPAESPATPQR